MTTTATTTHSCCAILSMSIAVVVIVIGGGCSPDAKTERRTAVEHGRDLFADRAASGSPLNRFSCTTCHATTNDDVRGRILPGFVLAGAVRRPTFWGGVYDDLLLAVNNCRYYFMAAPTAWTPADEEAKAMYAFLSSLAPSLPDAQPMTVPVVAVDLPPGGDAVRGQAVFEASCRTCHGEIATGAGRIREGVPALPDETVRVFGATYGFTKDQIRLSVIEKVRHGVFLGVYGSMPFYSKESLSDADLGALISYFRLY